MSNRLIVALRQNEPFHVIQQILRDDPHLIRESDDVGWLPVHQAAYSGATFEVVQHLVEMHPGALQETMPDGFLALHHACDNNASLEVIKCLVDKRPEALGEKTSDGYLPLHLACDNMASVEVIRFLVDKRPDSLEEKTNDGWLPLHLACDNIASVEVIKFLVDKRPESVGETTPDGCLPLHCACDNNASLEVIKFLVDKRPESVGEKTNDGWLPLHLSSHFGVLETVQYLVQTRPSMLQVTNSEGERPVDVARRNAKVCAAEWLEAAMKDTAGTLPSPSGEKSPDTAGDATAHPDHRRSSEPKEGSGRNQEDPHKSDGQDGVASVAACDTMPFSSSPAATNGPTSGLRVETQQHSAEVAQASCDRSPQESTRAEGVSESRRTGAYVNTDHPLASKGPQESLSTEAAAVRNPPSSNLRRNSAANASMHPEPRLNATTLKMRAKCAKRRTKLEVHVELSDPAGGASQGELVAQISNLNRRVDQLQEQIQQVLARQGAYQSSGQQNGSGAAAEAALASTANVAAPSSWSWLWRRATNSWNPSGDDLSARASLLHTPAGVALVECHEPSASAGHGLAAHGDGVQELSSSLEPAASATQAREKGAGRPSGSLGASSPPRKTKATVAESKSGSHKKQKTNGLRDGP
jgi:ankyrin repeat protein